MKKLLLPSLLLLAGLLLLGCIGSQQDGQQKTGGEQATAAAQQTRGELGVFEDDSEEPPGLPSREKGGVPALPEDGKTEVQAEPTSALADGGFEGLWRVFSSRIFYDIGGAGGMTGTTRTLELDGEGNWAFGSSHGKWSVQPISSGDWEKWGIEPYGPTKKIILEEWNGRGADGPVEESGGNTDFFWAIYPVEPPEVENAGTVQTKFGHAN